MSDYSDPRWQKKRLLCMDRDGWRCCCCKSETATLHVHHKRYCGDIWESPLDDLQTLCDACHASLGRHPKAGVWWSTVGDSGRHKGCNWTDEAGDDSVALAVQHCPECGGHAFGYGKGSLVCRACHSTVASNQLIFLVHPASCVSEEEFEEQRRAEEAEKTRRQFLGQLKTWARKCRECGASEVDVFSVVFPETAVPESLKLLTDGTLEDSALLADEIQRVRAWLTSGMSFGDIAFELVGDSSEAKKALANSGY